MKLITFVILLFIACKESKPKLVIVNDNKIIKPTIKRVEHTSFYIKEDSIVLPTINDWKLVYSKQDFNEIVDNFPTLHQEIPDKPDSSYSKSGIHKTIIDANGNEKKISFPIKKNK